MNACQKKTESNSGIPVIRIDDVVVKPVYTSEIFDSIEYVCLETTSDCLLKYPRIDVTEKYIIARGPGAYLFDRKTGKFIHEIGKKGQGPDEYNSIPYQPFNEKTGIFYVDNSRQWLGFDIVTNKVVEKLNLPKGIGEVLLGSTFTLGCIEYVYKIDSLSYIGITTNMTGDNPYLLAIFDKDGNIIKTYPNYQHYTDYKKNEYPPYGGLIYEYNDKLYFKEYLYNDTIFEVRKDIIIPYLVFDLGDRKPDYKEKENPSINPRNYYHVEMMPETEHYLFFNYWINDDYYEACYDKEKKTAFATLSSTSNYAMWGYLDKDNKYPPLNIHKINQRGEAVGIIYEPSVMSVYMEKHKDTKYPDAFYNLQEDDNPIIAIAKIK
jgi:hypothetical protein